MDRTDRVSWDMMMNIKNETKLIEVSQDPPQHESSD